MQRGGKEKLGPWDGDPIEVAHTIIEPDKERWSGLYDHNGQKLVRPETKVGFDLNVRRRT